MEVDVIYNVMSQAHEEEVQLKIMERTEEGYSLKHVGHGVGAWSDGDSDSGDVFSTLLIWEKGEVSDDVQES